MKYQELKLQLKFHTLFILYTHTSLNNNLALQFIIFLKNRLFFIISYYQGLLLTLIVCDYSEQYIFELCLTFLHS